MKKRIVHLFCGMGLTLLLVAFSAAQDAQFEPIAATVNVSQLPAAGPIFSNCGATCSTYNGKVGYFIDGGFYSGQTLAVPFKTKKAASFTKALLPLTIYTGGGGDDHGKVTVELLKDDSGQPGAPIAVLTQVGTINDKNWTVVEYEVKKPMNLKAKTQYWLCAVERGNSVEVVWAKNSTGDHADWYGQDGNSCFPASWNPIGGTQHVPPAYAVF